MIRSFTLKGEPMPGRWWRKVVIENGEWLDVDFERTSNKTWVRVKPC